MHLSFYNTFCVLLAIRGFNRYQEASVSLHPSITLDIFRNTNDFNSHKSLFLQQIRTQNFVLPQCFLGSLHWEGGPSRDSKHQPKSISSLKKIRSSAVVIQKGLCIIHKSSLTNSEIVSIFSKVFIQILVMGSVSPPPLYFPSEWEQYGNST